MKLLSYPTLIKPPTFIRKHCILNLGFQMSPIVWKSMENFQSYGPGSFSLLHQSVNYFWSLCNFTMWLWQNLYYFCTLISQIQTSSHACKTKKYNEWILAWGHVTPLWPMIFLQFTISTLILIYLHSIFAKMPTIIYAVLAQSRNERAAAHTVGKISIFLRFSNFELPTKLTITWNFGWIWIFAPLFMVVYKLIFSC